MYKYDCDYNYILKKKLRKNNPAHDNVLVIKKANATAKVQPDLL